MNSLPFGQLKSFLKILIGVQYKGKIENTVKFIKGNFLNNRLYVDDEILNRSCLEWLERTGKAKVHGTTKKIPAEVFKEEREKLRPLVTVDQNAGSYILRTVRKDNTIIYDSNRYSVPLGTYNTNPEVQLEIADGNLRILTVFGDFLCEHRISTSRGHLIQNKSHLRDRATALDQLQDSLDEQLDGRAVVFLQRIREEKSRYARDQFRLLQSLLDKFGTEQILDAISFCMDSNLCSANMPTGIWHSLALPEPARHILRRLLAMNAAARNKDLFH